MFKILVLHKKGQVIPFRSMMPKAVKPVTKKRLDRTPVRMPEITVKYNNKHNRIYAKTSSDQQLKKPSPSKSNFQAPSLPL